MQPSVTNHSYSEPARVRVTHLALDLSIDFDRRVARGSVTLTLDRPQPASFLRLDSDRITVEKIWAIPSGDSLAFEISDRDSTYGSALTIELPPDVDQVQIDYETASDASAFQWLEPAQTFSKRTPFLYSQSWPILARSWIPCQDTPEVRSTFDATIRVPKGMRAVMGAVAIHSDAETGVYCFQMRQPIPSFLIAIAVGELEFVKISDRSGIYAEPALVQSAAWEFSETETLIEAAERLYGPYQWDRWDILALPPSFPYGGMENPQLTFVSSGWICGDRSMVIGITHELAHSWSGNLVVHADWDDFWITEAFTVYCERRITEAVQGWEFSEALSDREHQVLLKTIDTMGAENPETCLRANLGNRNPESVLTPIRFFKGYLFIRHLEKTFGRERWDAYFNLYLRDFAFQSIRTEDFLKHIRTHLIQGDADTETRANLDAWIFKPGLPESRPRVRSALLEQAKMSAGKWTSGTPLSQNDVDAWSMVERIQFLQSLPKILSTDQFESLEALLRPRHNRNPQFRVEWLRRVASSRYESAFPDLEEMLKTQGNLQFLRQLYQAIAETDRDWARELYRKYSAGYHALTRMGISSVLST